MSDVFDQKFRKIQADIFAAWVSIPGDLAYEDFEHAVLEVLHSQEASSE